MLSFHLEVSYEKTAFGHAPGGGHDVEPILQAYGGTATLATHRNQLEELGETEYLRIQQMNGHCPKDVGYPGCFTPEGEQKRCEGCWVVRMGARWVRFERNEQYQLHRDKR